VRSCAIFNPAAGRGKAAKWEADLRARLPEGTTFLPTTHAGHAVELAKVAASTFERVIAAGGDGTVHEVAEGLLRANRPDVLFSVIPLGSANDYAFTLGVLDWWTRGGAWAELTPMLVDVGIVRGGGRDRFFVNGCGLGFNGHVTIEARKIRWLRGVALYSVAVVKTLIRHFASPKVTVTLDDAARELETLVLSFGLGQREGGFPLAALASLDDGLFDWLHVGSIQRWELIRHLPAMISGDLPITHPKLTFGRCRRATVRGDGPLCVHTDGEMFAVPGDCVREVEVAVLPNRLRVEVFAPQLYGADRFLPIQKRRNPPG
jgi:diacylglycerol kinase family enzyme